ncbi:MAG: hypothetical protein ACI9OB_000240 [Nonlabens sp.]|jgi:hypothetical protein
MSDSTPIRLTSVMGVARALLATFEPHEAVEVLGIEFGWDITFQALLLLRGEDAEAALLRCLELLLTDPVSDELRDVSWRTSSSTD